ncbi:MAG TPA: hypothetical protein VFU81_03635, partial [Thermomicrobiales bacterium]|nr:hypothetical protein [Thermomicrobiales bacterium]
MSNASIPDERVNVTSAPVGASNGAASANGAAPAEPPVQPRDLPPLTPELFINRELSWLEFNRRVLEEAAEWANPLLERIKFIAIFSSNLDEFFMIRVAGVCRKIAMGIAEPGPDGRTPTQALAAIRATTQALLDEQAAILGGELLPALAAAGIEIVPYATLDVVERAALADRFEREIFPILTPQAIDRARRFPHVSNRSLNLLVALQLPSGARFGRVKIPATLPRFVPVLPAAEAGDREGASRRLRFVLLEQVVAAHLGRLFTGAEALATYPFHLIRDSDIELDEDGDQDGDDGLNLMATMRESIAQRAFGPVVRLTVDATMPEDVRAWLVEHVHARSRDLYVVDGP